MEEPKVRCLQKIPATICGCFGKNPNAISTVESDVPKIKTDVRLKIIYRILKIYGFHFFLDGWKISVRFIFFATLLLTTLIRDGYCFVLKIKEGDVTIPEYVEVMTFIQTQSITLYRIWVILRHRKKFRKLVNYTVETFPSWINETTRELLGKRVKAGMWICWVHSVQLVGVVFMLMVRPLLSGEPNAMIMRPPLGTLPYMPTDVTPWYQITYIFQVWKAIIQTNMAFCMNILFFTVCIRACAHMDCIAKDLDALSDDPAAKDPSVIIKEFVDRYNTTREFFQLLNNLFYIITAVQPLYTAVSIITSLLVFDGTEQSYSFAGIAVAHVLELFIYCYAGDLTAEKSLALSDKLFEARWYNLQQKDKRSVLFALHQCQKPFNIRAGLFGKFSRHMFTTTMKTTYSTWAVAKQIK